MSLLTAVLYGIIQGLSEWLPISSEGIVSALLVATGSDAGDAVRLALVLHMGSALAAIIYFRKDVAGLFRHLPSFSLTGGSPEVKTIRFLGLATMISFIVAYPLYRFLDLGALDLGVWFGLVGLALVVTGVIQVLQPGGGARTEADLGMADGVFIGILQGFAVVPGISRSGITIATLLFRDLDSEKALRLSFLLSIPVVLGAQAAILVLDGMAGLPPWDELLVSLLVTLVVSLLTIDLFLRVARRIRFGWFLVCVGVLTVIPAILILLGIL